MRSPRILVILTCKVQINNYSELIYNPFFHGIYVAFKLLTVVLKALTNVSFQIAFTLAESRIQGNLS